MAGINDFQSLYTVIKAQLPDLGGLVSDFPKIIMTVENNAPLAMSYIQSITEKLLQDIASRESVYTISTTCKDLSNALKDKKVIPPVINQHLDFIIGKISMPNSSKNIDEAYAAFESLVSLLQWQHGKYYISADDDYEMLLTDDETLEKPLGSMGLDPDEFKVKYKKSSTAPKNEIYYTAEGVLAKRTRDENGNIISDEIATDVEHELKMAKKTIREAHKRQSSSIRQRASEIKKPVSSLKTPNESAGKPEIKSVAKEVQQKKAMKSIEVNDIPATIVAKQDELLGASIASDEPHLKKTKLMQNQDVSTSSIPARTTVDSRILREVHRPTKGPSPLIYGAVALASFGFLVIGIIWGTTFRSNNVENQTTQDARLLLEQSSELKNLKSMKSIPDTIVSYTQMLTKIDNFNKLHPSWSRAFEETIISLRTGKDELQKELDREAEKQKMLILVKDALNSEDVKFIEDTLDSVFEMLLRYPELSDNFDTEVSELEKRINGLKRIQELVKDMKLARRQADSLKETTELTLLYRNLGILKWFFAKLPEDSELTESLNVLELKIEHREDFDQVEIRMNYLVGIYDVAIKSKNYNEVRVAIDLIDEFLVDIKPQVDDNPDAPKHLKSLYRELNTKLTLLREKEDELKEEEAMLIYSILVKQADDLKNSVDQVKLRIQIEKIEEFMVEYPELKNDIEDSRQMLLKQLALIEKLGNSLERITVLIAEATNLLRSSNPLEIDAMIVKINEFIKEMPTSEESFTNILKDLNDRKKMLEIQIENNEKTNQLIQQSELARSKIDIVEVVKVINGINEFKRVSLRDEVENAFFILKLERELRKLTDRYQELCKVEIVIDSPGEGKVFQTREVTIEGHVVNSLLEQVQITLAGWTKVVNVVNGAFSADMLLISGSNHIEVAAFSSEYHGKAICEVTCTVARSELYVKLTWERSDSAGGEGIALPDLDLYVTEPSGKTVYYDEPFGDAGELLEDSREGKKPEIYELSTLQGHKIVEGTYYIRVKYAEDRSIPRKEPEPGKKMWAGYLPKPAPVKFKLVIFRKGKFYAEYTGEIKRMDYIHNGHEAWLAYPKAWWDKTCPIVIAK